MIMALQKNKEQGKIVRFNVVKRICSQVFFYHLDTFIQPAFTYLKVTIETTEQGVKYVLT